MKNGDTIVVDGRDGHVLVNPDAETESAYRKLQREFFDLKDPLAENRDQPAVTADGETVELLANINSLADAEAAAAMGAAGVGLFRTEYLFLTHPDVPDEEEQFAAYREIIAASPSHRVTIRTLDLGGDKTIPYLGHDREANPFMGWRSIRLSFEHPEFFAHADPGDPAGRAPMARQTAQRAADVSDDHHAGRNAPRARRWSAAGPAQLEASARLPRRPRADRADARGAGGRRVDRRAAGSGRLRLDRLERPGAVPDGGRPRQPEGQPPLPAAQPAVLKVLLRRDRRLQRGGQAGDAVRRNGRHAAGVRAAVRHGPAQLQHEPGVHSDDQGTALPLDGAQPK